MKIILACTSGGHFSTMRGLEPFWSQHERVWITDLKQDTKMLEGRDKVHWLPYQAPRDWVTTLTNFPKTFNILMQERPDIVVSTGASIAVNLVVAAKILGIRFLYVESISRSEELSLSGKLIYPLADEFYVQWQQLTDKYSRAIFKGTVT